MKLNYWLWETSASQATDHKNLLFSILIIFALGAFHLSTIRQGHDWGDDFGMYINHARNIVEGRPYADTGYIYNPRYVIGPKTYPPVFPLLLAPVYKLMGLNLTAMKVEIILIFMISLYTMYLSFRNELPWPYLPILIALVGFNPQFWLFKDSIVSDLPFLLFTYLSFFLIHNSHRVSRSMLRRLIYALLIAISHYLAYGTRSIGLILIPCTFIYYLLKNKKLDVLSGLILLMAIAFVFIQSGTSHSISAYTDHFGFNIFNIMASMSFELTRHVSLFFANGYSNFFGLALFAVLLMLSVTGFITRLGEKNITCFELFVPFYLGPLIVLPIQLELRFAMPLIPLFIFYSFIGIKAISCIAARRQRRVERLIFAGVSIAVLASYAGQYTRLNYGPIRNGISTNEVQQLFDYIKQETGENDVIIFRKPRALSLFTERPAAVWHIPMEDKELFDFFKGIKASYLIVGPLYVEPWDQQFILNFIDRNRERFAETYTNADFRVYRIVNGTT
ncbi:MAG: hypothetical protein IPM55_03205 [Acidobacteria bacterium]|nr:hypothetical protein [Acidobacteriota bacterium]